MSYRRLRIMIFTALLLLAGFAMGRVLTIRQLAAVNGSEQSPTSVNEPAAMISTPTPPTQDVAGADISDLPRYPGAIRTEYRQEVINNLLNTEVEYLVSAELEAVHNFYRNVFDEEGWSVADLGIHMGEWTFFVVSEEREALVELEIEYGLVEIEIEITEPVTSGE